MNDPGLEGSIQNTATHVTRSLRERVRSSSENAVVQIGQVSKPGKSNSHFPAEEFRKELQMDEDEEEIGHFAPQRWWFTSTAFPLVSGTFGPLANLFSVCALVQDWRVEILNGETEDQGQPIPDPHWLVALNAASFSLAIIANILLLFNFAHRVRYMIAQPLTIALWYISSILLLVPLALLPSVSPPSNGSSPIQHALSKSYYFALLSAILYVVLSTLLLLHLIFSLPPFSAYPSSFAALTIPQRTLMLQTVSFNLYLALGAGIFAALEGWEYCDAVYWADYTVLTIGLGSDFPLTTSAGKGVLIPYASGGILLIGIVIGSVRGLVLERGGIKMMHRRTAKERDRKMDEVAEIAGKTQNPDEALQAEFEAMRLVADRAEFSRKYHSLGISCFVFLLVWFLGAMVFFYTEQPQNWTYGTSLYFTYTALTTIGYGDLVPQSNSGKPFFVLWTLIAVPSVTILISNIGDTVVSLIQRGTMWLGQRTILPERSIGRDKKTNARKKGFWPIKNVEKAVNEEKTREIEEGSAPDPSGGVRGDIDKLGKAIETVQEEHGHGGGLATQLAKEIRLVSKDLGSQPPRKYEWEDWKRWVKLLGSGPKGLDELRSATAHSESADNSKSHHHWIWLGDEGPLFSGSESNWILAKLCERLEQVLMEEVQSRKNKDH